MSKFFKALEQAERERALRAQAPQQEATPTEVSPAPAAGREVSPRAAIPAAAEPPTAPRVVDQLPVGEHHRQPNTEPISELSGVPPEGVEEHLVSLLTPASSEAEHYRALRHLVEQLHKAADLFIVAVSSPAGRDGKTTTAINLAGALAQAPEARVLLVDADLRRPSIVDDLGLENPDGHGLVDAILDPNLALEDVVQGRSPYNLSVLPAGRRRPSIPYELLKSPRLGELLAEARRRYEYIVLDTPPLVQFPDCRVIAKWVDGFLVVVAAHSTPRKLVEEALSVLDPAKVVGLVFNGADRPLSERYYAYRLSADGDRRGWRGQRVKRVSGSFRGHFGRVRTSHSAEE